MKLHVEKHVMQVIVLYEVYFKIRWQSGYILDLHIGDIH